RPDHQDVLRRNLFGELRRELLAPHAVAQPDRDGALGGALSDHVLVQLGDDLTRRQRVGRRLRLFRKVNGHYSSSTTIRAFVYMQISPAIAIDFSAIACASRSVL